MELVRRAYRQHLAVMSRQRAQAGPLAPAVGAFLKVTRSYWRGLFRCYEVPDLPRTNNALEQVFGAARCQTRRMTGKKAAPPSLVVRGAVQLTVAVASRTRTFSAADLQPTSLADWRRLRAEVDQRHAARRAQLRFRRDPATYLTTLETTLVQLALPP